MRKDGIQAYKDMGVPTVVSLFAGCGGSSLGYRWAGFRELLAVEWEQNAIGTFRLNFPGVPVWERDISKLSGQEILDFCKIEKGELDVLDGSPPCQGYSIVGKRIITDKRNDLFRHNIRLIGEIEPKVFVIENVAGMVRGKMKGIFKEYMKLLRVLDYRVKCKLMNAKYYNVPQSRQRLIWIGARKSIGIEPQYPEPNLKYITAKQAIGHLEETSRKKVTPGLLPFAILLKPGEEASKYHPQGKLFGLRRLYPNSPCNTLLKSAGTGFVHYKHSDQFLSVLELQILSSFPEDFRFIGTRGKQIDRIGNSVPPKFMEAIAKNIRINILEKAELIKQ